MDVTIVDTLIALVAERPTLWDKRNQKHSCRLEVEKCWKEIGEALKVDENALRKKWRYLRAQFWVELMVQASSKGVPKWHHFTALEFLRCTAVTARVYDKGDEYRDDSDNQDEQNSSDYLERSKVEEKKELKRRSKNKKKIKKYFQVNDGSVSDSCVYDEEDEHLLFFKSILTHVKKIPESKVLSFRNRIQCLVEEFAYGPNPTEFLPGFPIKSSPPQSSSVQ